MKFFKNSKKSSQAKITFYDGVNRAESGKVLSSSTIRKNTKQTVNLCRRERKGMSVAMFFLILAIILLALALVEFFAAYRPYVALEAKQNELAEKQQQLEELNSAMQDREAVQREYREYNYENFPFELVDKEEVLNLIKTKIFPYGKIVSVSVPNNTISLQVTGIQRNSVDSLMEGLRSDKMVANATMTTVAVNGEFEDIGLTIIFNDATEVSDNG